MIAAAHQTMLAPQGAPLPYDAEVEYIQADGVAYIDTGVPCSTLYAVTADYEVLDNGGAFLAIAGFWYRNSGGVESALRAFWRPASTEYRGQCGNPSSAATFGSAIAMTGRHSLSMTDGSITIDGTTKTTTARSATNSDRTQHLFGCDSYNPVSPSDSGHQMQSASSSMRIYSATWSLGGVLVRDFQPVRVGSGASAVGYLYDRANPTGGPLGNGLYGSATSSPLVAGPDK